jgi:FAD/FMN-containing dehydrogenase/Fe-S oxidoreductase
MARGTASRLERGLRATVRGEVRFDDKSRALYSTDASIYQIPPLGVVIPEDAEDARRALLVAAEEGVPILPRGGGTALAGQTVAAALVLDFSKRMHRILELDPERRRARVEPGVRLDRLNRAAAPHGLQFGPDPATLRQCAFGGMIGNNACGARSLVHGKTVDHVHGLHCLMAGGEELRLGRVPRSAVPSLPGREGEIARALTAAVAPHREAILSDYPRVPRRVSGYNLDMLAEGDELDLAALIVGSEGTLATVVEAEIGLVPLPLHRTLVLLAFGDRYQPLDAVPEILGTTGLSALEIVDDRILRSARALLEHRESAAIVPESTRGLLYAEFSSPTAEEARGRAEEFAERAKGLPGSPWRRVFTGLLEQDRAWALRRAGLGLLYRTQGDVKPVPFVEDTGVPPERIGAFTRRFDEIVTRSGTTTGFFGHAGQGCLHIRVDLDLKRGEEVGKMHRIAREVAELVVEFGGSLSGEHGDGLSRSEFLPLMFSPGVMDLHRTVKGIFDPEGRMNPGKIVDAGPMTENLRFGERYAATSPETYFDYTADGGFDLAVEKCNGMAVCRKLDAGTMCPSFMVLLEEEHSTRGRANTLREAMRGNVGGGVGGDAVIEALDLCLECKACRSECPVGVDMARYKAEALAHRHAERGASLEARVFGRIHAFARAGSRAPRAANLLSRLGEPLARRVLGLQKGRSLPKLAAHSFRSWFQARPATDPGGRTPVLLLDDTFHGYFEPEALRATVEVLEAAGFAPRLTEEPICCGRALISNGLLEEAREVQRHALEQLGPAVEAGTRVVGIEPSCILTFRDEAPDLARDPRSEVVAAGALTLEELLVESGYHPGSWTGRALVHGHCHQKALVGMGPTAQLLGSLQGGEVEILDAGCCGMAGSFGYLERHNAVSVGAAERVLAPAVRARGDAEIVAPGFSCRTQIRDLCGVRALHPAELLARALRRNPAPDGVL